MEIAHLVLEYLKVLAWPATAITIVFVFRGHLRGVLGRLTNGELDALGVKVRVDLSKAQADVQRAEDRAGSPPADSVEDDALREAQVHLEIEYNDFFSKVEKLLSAPEASAERIVSWTFIAYIQTVIECAKALGIDPVNSSFPANDVYGAAVLELEAAGIFNDDMARAAQRLIRIYSSQNPDSPPLGREVADLYFSTAKDLAGLVVTTTKTAMRQKAAGVATARR
ncbi:hypothetical protein SAMN04487912_105279 [Arthrobacter sp. cf158]|uniref:hypothetical protein n=1 Tax=Arthrobacter sp. cf158 TaxID=1761744 RepID=UPI000897BF31|nr:hypothetical protein [Arthrobacter sp. cf158]SDW89695.1 hypothetical protein SAMN04487912_105279 [Arthrobacter sp. cf158]